eukprot:53975_1
MSILIDDVKEGYGDSIILETIAEDIDIKDADKEPLCVAIHEYLSTFIPLIPLHLAKIDTKVSKNDIKTAKERVESTAFFFKQEAEDKDLLKVFAIGQKNHLPLVTYLVDTYSRLRLLKYIKLYRILSTKETSKGYTKYLSSKEFEGEAYEINQFVATCDAFKALHMKAKETNDSQPDHARQWFRAALNSVYRRGPMGNPLHMSPLTIRFKIDDPIAVHAKYYLSTLTAIHTIVQDAKSALPLQIDLWVIPTNMKNVETEQLMSENDNDSDVESDGRDDVEEKEMQVDHLDKRLKFTDNLVTDDIDPAADVDALSSILFETYRKVVQGEESKRMVMIIDRRDGTKDKDTLYAFMTKKSQNIP